MLSHEVITTSAGPVSFVRCDGPGDGAALFLHGIGASATFWDHIQVRTGRAQSVSWNAPGYGATPLLDTARPTIDDYVGLLRSLTNALGMNRLHLVGHSWGAILATRYALLHPAALASLTLINPTRGYSALVKAEKDRWLECRIEKINELGPERLAKETAGHLTSIHAPSHVLAAAATLGTDVSGTGMVCANRILADANLLAELPEVKVPVAAIFADDDRIVGHELKPQVLHALPQIKSVTIKNCGHLAPLEKLEETAEALLGFWATVDSKQFRETPGAAQVTE